MIRYFTDYRFDEAAMGFLPIGVRMHNPVDGDVGAYYTAQESPEYEEAMWVINRLVDADLKTPPDFLEFRQQRAGYQGMRAAVGEVDTDLSYDEFGRRTLEETIRRKNDAATI